MFLAHPLPSAPLEDWFRDHYFEADIDISASGVEPWSLGEVRRLSKLPTDQLDSLVFTDGWSLGRPEVRTAIAERWGTGDPRQVMTTIGSGEALWLVMMALLRPGDEVLAVTPGYHTLIEPARAIGCTVKPWNLDPHGGWKPAMDELDTLLTGSTRAIVVNFPHNPTGVSVTESEMRLILDAAGRIGAYVLWDAAFADITYDAPPLPDATKLYDRAISFGTFSKCYGLPGLRFGWCIGPPALLDDCVRMRDYTTLHVAPLIEMIALQVLEHLDSFLIPRRDRALQNRSLLATWAAENADRVELALPAGGVAAFPRLLRYDDTRDLCERLLHRDGVLVVPGECWGHPGHIRLGFGGPTGDLAVGLERLRQAMV